MQGSFTFSYRSGSSYARGTTIDPLISADDRSALYERWNTKWGEPLGFQGGEIAITCDMVVAVPLEDLVKTYGKSRAERLIEAASPFGEV